MTDRELLELAAKAAGIEFSSMGGGARYDPKPNTVQPYVLWNPLTDDGDALRLAVKLKMKIDVDFYLADVEAARYGSDPHVELLSNDPLAATRRAIVRAAAEIGRSMT